MRGFSGEGLIRRREPGVLIINVLNIVKKKKKNTGTKQVGENARFAGRHVFRIRAKSTLQRNRIAGNGYREGAKYAPEKPLRPVPNYL